MSILLLSSTFTLRSADFVCGCRTHAHFLSCMSYFPYLVVRHQVVGVCLQFVHYQVPSIIISLRGFLSLLFVYSADCVFPVVLWLCLQQLSHTFFYHFGFIQFSCFVLASRPQCLVSLVSNRRLALLFGACWWPYTVLVFLLQILIVSVSWIGYCNSQYCSDYLATSCILSTQLFPLLC